MPDYLPGSSTACYQVSTLLGPTALPQNAGTLYPDISPPTDNSLATNHRPFPGMENRFSTNYGLPSCLFHCLLQSPHSLDPLHCLRMLAHSTQTSLHPRTTHFPLITDLFHAWKTGFPPTTDCLPASSTAFYKVSTLLGPTALPHNAGTLYPDIAPPTDNSLATNHRPFPCMENRFSTNYGRPSCLFHCLLSRLHFCVANKY